MPNWPNIQGWEGHTCHHRGGIPTLWVGIPPFLEEFVNLLVNYGVLAGFCCFCRFYGFFDVLVPGNHPKVVSSQTLPKTRETRPAGLVPTLSGGGQSWCRSEQSFLHPSAMGCNKIRNVFYFPETPVCLGGDPVFKSTPRKVPRGFYSFSHYLGEPGCYLPHSEGGTDSCLDRRPGLAKGQAYPAVKSPFLTNLLISAHFRGIY